MVSDKAGFHYAAPPLNTALKQLSHSQQVTWEHRLCPIQSPDGARYAGDFDDVDTHELKWKGLGPA